MTQAPLNGPVWRRGRAIIAAASALRGAGIYLHTRQNNHAKREIRRLKTISAIARDVTRKIGGNTVLEQRFAAILHRVERVLAQQRHDRNKLYALHVLEVECLAKGRRTRSTSSASRSVSPQPTAQASCSACWLCPATPMMAIPSTPPPGRPERLTGTSIERLYVDRGST
jgi:transposase, IS5 family